MFTDMVGYTGLGQRNEQLSLALVEQQGNLLRPIILKHHGRKVKTIGDALLVEFVSALDAVNCAVEIQSRLKELSRSAPRSQRFAIRIGIHLGDVVHRAGDVYGDAVNIASRVEPLAPPGGVCVSAQVYQSVAKKAKHRFESLGFPKLKNVTTPMEVFRIAGIGGRPPKLEQRSFPRPERIAVLPFINMSPDPNDAFFSDGLTEELIDRLCQIRELEVISRTSVMIYKKKEMKAAEIAKELSVGSLVEGSVRKAGDKIRVTAQLIDPSTEGHLWSSRYDRDLKDIFSVQTDIAEQVADALRVKLLPSERMLLEKRVTDSIPAYEFYLKGRYYLNLFKSREDLAKALGYFQEAVNLDPRCAVALAGISQYYHLASHRNWLSPEEAFPRMKEFALKALDLDPALAEAHGALGAVYFHYDWRWEDAEMEFRKAIELRPNFAAAFDMYQHQAAILGDFDKANELVARGMKVSPRHGGGWGITQAQLALHQGRLQEGVTLLENAVKSDPNNAFAHFSLGFAYYRASRAQDGLTELRKAAALSKGDLSVKAGLCELLALCGEEREAREMLREFEDASKTSFISLVEMAAIQYVLGRTDEAFENLNRAFEQKAIDLPEIRLWPEMDRLRSDPRWLSIEDKMGLLNAQVGKS